MFTNIDSNVVAYGLLHHRHTPEMEQEIGAQVTVHPAPRPDEPRDPRHLLRPSGGRLLADARDGSLREASTPASPSPP